MREFQLDRGVTGLVTNPVLSEVGRGKAAGRPGGALGRGETAGCRGPGLSRLGFKDHAESAAIHKRRAKAENSIRK